METDWWAASVRNLGNIKLLQNLINFDKESLNDKIINNLGNFLKEPMNKEILSVENVSKSSIACEYLIKWINGIFHFYFVNQKILPKKVLLK